MSNKYLYFSKGNQDSPENLKFPGQATIKIVIELVPRYHRLKMCTFAYEENMNDLNSTKFIRIKL